MQTALIKMVQFHLLFLYQKSSAGYFRPFLRSESGHGRKLAGFPEEGAGDSNIGKKCVTTLYF